MQYLSRQEFLERKFDYEPGQHLNIIGSTGTGKTTWFGQLLGKVGGDYPNLGITYLVPKAIDPIMDDWAKKLNYKVVQDWPPSKRWWEAKPDGYMLWPPHVQDAKENNEKLSGVFKNAANQAISTGYNILVADDAYTLAANHKMQAELNRHWTDGRSAQSGLWTALQKPSGTAQGGVSTFAYSQPTHMFFGRDNNKDNLGRISDMNVSSGIDPDYIRSVVSNLKVTKINGSAVSEILYVNQAGPFMAVIGI